jgi:hypothetical protein
VLVRQAALQAEAAQALADLGQRFAGADWRLDGARTSRPTKR